jgi:hypothetical protein
LGASLQLALPQWQHRIRVAHQHSRMIENNLLRLRSWPERASWRRPKAMVRRKAMPDRIAGCYWVPTHCEEIEAWIATVSQR